MQENLREMQELSLDELEMVSGGDAVPTESDVKSPPGSTN